MKMMMMILRQLGHVINNFDSRNSVHCRDIAQVPSVTTPPLVMSLLDNGDTDRGTDCKITITWPIGFPWVDW